MKLQNAEFLGRLPGITTHTCGTSFHAPFGVGDLLPSYGKASRFYNPRNFGHLRILLKVNGHLILKSTHVVFRTPVE